MVMMSEEMHKRTGEQEQIGHCRKNVTGMGCQQVSAHCSGHNAHRQPKLRLEKVAKRDHGDSDRSLFPETAIYSAAIGIRLS
jgi:hypothetical protein